MSGPDCLFSSRVSDSSLCSFQTVRGSCGSRPRPHCASSLRCAACHSLRLQHPIAALHCIALRLACSHRPVLVAPPRSLVSAVHHWDRHGHSHSAATQPDTRPFPTTLPHLTATHSPTHSASIMGGHGADTPVGSASHFSTLQNLVKPFVGECNSSDRRQRPSGQRTRSHSCATRPSRQLDVTHRCTVALLLTRHFTCIRIAVRTLCLAGAGILALPNAFKQGGVLVSHSEHARWQPNGAGDCGGRLSSAGMGWAREMGRCAPVRRPVVGPL